MLVRAWNLLHHACVPAYHTPFNKAFSLSTRPLNRILAWATKLGLGRASTGGKEPSSRSHRRLGLPWLRLEFVGLVNVVKHLNHWPCRSELLTKSALDHPRAMQRAGHLQISPKVWTRWRAREAASRDIKSSHFPYDLSIYHLAIHLRSLSLCFLSFPR